jgi:hypothetical protein
MPAICTPDSTGNYPPACINCVNNTLKSTATECNPPGAAECTSCYTQGQACVNDG